MGLWHPLDPPSLGLCRIQELWLWVAVMNSFINNPIHLFILHNHHHQHRRHRLNTVCSELTLTERNTNSWVCELPRLTSKVANSVSFQGYYYYK